MASFDDLGFSSFFSKQLLDREPTSPPLTPARVASESHGLLHLVGSTATLGELTGAFSHPVHPQPLPVVGDWVLVDAQGDRAMVHEVLKRRSLMVRKAVGAKAQVQQIAANVDTFFIVTSANGDMNPRRLERYLAAVWDSGASPVIVLNKVDLIEDLEHWRETLEELAIGVPVVLVSAQEQTGLDGLRALMSPGHTVAFVGSSGVGKSTLVNRLRGSEASSTQEIRDDGKGRHTTTTRELMVLDDEETGTRGILIDTPGMRELGLVDDSGGLEAAFADVAEFGEECRFRDCGHRSEPGCAVHQAVEEGRLDEQRLASFLKLRHEVNSAPAPRDPASGVDSKKRWKAIHQNIREHFRHHPGKK